MVRTRPIQNFELFEKEKTRQDKTRKKKKTNVYHFWQNVDAILEDISVTEQLSTDSSSFVFQNLVVGHV